MWEFFAFGAGVWQADVGGEIGALSVGGFEIDVDVRPGFEDGGAAHEGDVFSGLDGVSDVQIRADGGQMHVAHDVIFEWALGDANGDDGSAAPFAVISREWIDQAVARDEDLARVGFAGAASGAGTGVGFAKIECVLAGAPDKRDDAWGRGVDDGAHAAVFAAHGADVEASVAASIAVVKAHEISVGIGLDISRFDGEPEF